MNLMLSFVDTINDFGNKIFDTIMGRLMDMPGAFKGVAAVAIAFFTVIGILSVFKKSIKIAFTLALILLVLLVISRFVFK